MKKYLFNKRGGGLSTIIMTVGLILICLLSFPFFRSLQNDDKNSTQKIGTTVTRFTDSAIGDSAMPNYNGTIGSWDK